MSFKLESKVPNFFVSARFLSTMTDWSYNPGQKSMGQWRSTHSFLSFLGSLLKQCILCETFSQFSVTHPIQSWNSEKIVDMRVQRCLWWWVGKEGGGGVGGWRGKEGWAFVNWKKAPQIIQMVPRLVSMRVGLKGNIKNKTKGSFRCCRRLQVPGWWIELS